MRRGRARLGRDGGPCVNPCTSACSTQDSSAPREALARVTRANQNRRQGRLPWTSLALTPKHVAEEPRKVLGGQGHRLVPHPCLCHGPHGCGGYSVQCPLHCSQVKNRAVTGRGGQRGDPSRSSYELSPVSPPHTCFSLANLDRRPTRTAEEGVSDRLLFPQGVP